jgi:hypothetical protein
MDGRVLSKCALKSGPLHLNSVIWRAWPFGAIEPTHLEIPPG